MNATLQTLAALDNAATRFDDCPCALTATSYHAIASLYSRLGLIDPDEFANIVALVLSYSGA